MPGLESAPGWSQDGAIIAFAYLDGNHYNIYYYEFASGSISPLTTTPYEDQSPVFMRPSQTNISLDITANLQKINMQKIVYSSMENNITDIFIMDESGLKKNRLTSTTREPPSDITPGMSPDRKKIAYASNTDSNLNIYLYDIETEISTQLTESEGNDLGPPGHPTAHKLHMRLTPTGITRFT